MWPIYWEPISPLCLYVTYITCLLYEPYRLILGTSYRYTLYTFMKVEIIIIIIIVIIIIGCYVNLMLYNWFFLPIELRFIWLSRVCYYYACHFLPHIVLIKPWCLVISFQSVQMLFLKLLKVSLQNLFL